MARIDRPERPGLVTRLAWRIARRKSGGTLPEPFALMAHSRPLLHGYAGIELAFERTKGRLSS